MNVTAILCTYNRCHDLTDALSSVALSRVPASIDWEVLVVDNNSTDQTHDVVKRFELQYPGRFRYLFEPQQGKSHALNAGIRASQSEILAFMDDDAKVDPEWLGKLVSSLHDGKCAGAGGRIIPVWPGSIPTWLRVEDPNALGPFVAFDPGTGPAPLVDPPYGANMAFRRDAFEKYGNFLTNLGPRPGSDIKGEDTEFGQRLLNAGERIWYEPDAVVHHPVPECRLKKSYVLSWWYWHGREEVLRTGSPLGAARLVFGISPVLLRRIVRWTLQWLTSVGAQRRFYCRCRLSYVAGLFVGCYRRSRHEKVEILAAGRVAGVKKESTSSRIEAQK
jgi:glycosyltransferase involved in cell wall biosynthesis